MPSSFVTVHEETSVEVLFERSIESSSEEPPMAEWSSLFLVDASVKEPKELFKKGLYSPGSGEICGKLIAMSDSNVLRHLHYKYPAIKDPGIMEALLEPCPKKIYAYDGQELYLDLCKEMNVIPVRGFYKGLLNDEINLKYYGVNPVGVRAMCLALTNNINVRRLDLTSNLLTRDACYHLGQLLGDSFALQELVLSGCKLGPVGLMLLVDRMSKRAIDVLDVSRNGIGDEGFKYLADQIEKGATIKRLNLSYNELTGSSYIVFANAIERNNTITHLDLSWNEMSAPKGIGALLLRLAESKVLSELNFSWNALTISESWDLLLEAKTLQVLDLSNNRLSNMAVKNICSKLYLATNLHTLDLSHNLLSPSDALLLLKKMKNKKVALRNLYMDDLSVTKEFVKKLQAILSLDYRVNTIITYGRVMNNYTLETKDLKEIVMRRIVYLTQPTKRCKTDVLLLLLQAQTEKRYMQPGEIHNRLKNAGVTALDKDFLEEMTNVFPGPRIDKSGKTVNLDDVMDYVRRVCPEKELVLPLKCEAVVENKKEVKKKNQNIVEKKKKK